MFMKRTMSSSSEKRNSAGIDGGPEIRPGGMLVQKRISDENNAMSLPIPSIRVRVKYGSTYHDVSISSQASFGELKKKLSEWTGLHPEEQKLVYKDKERESKAFLDIARVKNGSKIVLIEDIASRERRLLEMRRNSNAEKASKSLASIASEVDKLQMQVKDLESMASKGASFEKMDVGNLIEKLMSMLIQLDGIVANGDLKMKRRIEVRRVQRNIEVLDELKLQISNPTKSMEARIRDEKSQSTQRTINRGNCSAQTQNPVFHRLLVKNSELTEATTKWETFD